MSTTGDQQVEGFRQVPPPPAASRRRWPIALAGGVFGAAATTAVAALTTFGQTKSAPIPAPPPAVTVTATPPPAPTPEPQPTAQADRHTCEAWLAAGSHIHAASGALKGLPEGVVVTDPGVPGNPQWSAAVKTAVAEYARASETLTAGIAPGTTPILQTTATAAAAALHALAIADGTADATSGNAFHTTHEASDMMDVLCERLAPR